MDDKLNQIYDRLAERYASGEKLPWDDLLPPPEVIDLVGRLEPGRALDLGCGFGRAAIYMATLGWDVDGVDFIPMAIEEATRRAAEAGVIVRFHLAQVTDLDFLTGQYDFALDVGCAHNLDLPRLKLYKNQLVRLLRPGGDYLLFGRLHESGEVEEENSFSGLDENEFLSTFLTDFDLVWFERGITEVADQSSWSSAWYHFRRLNKFGY